MKELCHRPVWRLEESEQRLGLELSECWVNRMDCNLSEAPGTKSGNRGTAEEPFLESLGRGRGCNQETSGCAAIPGIHFRLESSGGFG